MRSQVLESDEGGVASMLLGAIDGVSHRQDRVALFIVAAIIICAGAAASTLTALSIGSLAVSIVLGVLAGAILYAAAARSSAAQLRTVALEAIEHSESDALTGLPNRDVFTRKLAISLNALGEDGEAALVFYDIDGLRKINSRHGHRTGDALINGVADRLKRLMRDGEIIARLDGDEFAVAATGPGASQRIAKFTRDVASVLANPFPIDGSAISISLSGGIVVARRDVSADELLRRAEVVLEEAKATNPGTVQRYSAMLGSSGRGRKEMKTVLEKAMANNQFEVHFQPIVSAATGRIAGAEALLRPQNQEGSGRLPIDFLNAAEESGDILKLGRWILRRTLTHARTWKTLPVWVNISPLQFRSPGFSQMVASCLEESGFDPKLLKLEITESVLLSHPEIADRVMYQLQSLGVSLVLDDFGSGLSSLAHLRRFRFDTVKVDRASLCLEHGDDPTSGLLLKAVVDLAHSLGFEVVMESVENEKHADVVRLLGCDLVQGFLIGAPMEHRRFKHRFLSGDRKSSEDAKFWAAQG